MVPFLGELMVAAVRAHRHHRVVLREGTDTSCTSSNLQTSGTVCSRWFDQFYVANYLLEWVKTWTFSMEDKNLINFFTSFFLTFFF